MNLTELRATIEESFLPLVIGSFGPSGSKALREITTKLHEIYREVDPESLPQPFIVVRPIEGDFAGEEGVQLASPLDLRNHQSPNLLVGVAANGTLHVVRKEGADIASLSNSCLVYKYENGFESFLAGGHAKPVNNLYAGVQSVFASPTFSQLHDALLHYGRQYAVTCKCYVYQTAWFDENRLFFKEKPESTLRRSLEQFLGMYLRGAVAYPEQNVDETHPIDIKLAFQLVNRTALIEIKWLGKSKARDGALKVQYSAGRARDGAQQLADYLAWYSARNPTENVKGYLVVYDGRRKGLPATATSISQADGMHYSKFDIVYKPDYSVLRRDFEAPLRMFTEPICVRE
jgi:hypothetical protein